MTTINITSLEEKQKYVYSLARKIKEDLTNEDIEVCIKVLNYEEKEFLQSILKQMKLEVKTPEDYSINRKIYKTIAIIMDLAVIKQKRNSLIPKN